MNNLLLQQYAVYKRESLKNSPFHCLLNTEIDINPHQVDAFCCAVNSLKTGGIILADEVGLGKTIEAGLLLKYVIDSGAKKIMLVLPASLRKQWEIELEEKFKLNYDCVRIIDKGSITYSNSYMLDDWLLRRNRLSIVIVSYDFSSKLINAFRNVKWDFIVIDEAHNLRNVFHGTKRAKRLYEATKGIPKILLTATPLQNSLEDLHGLVSFIDNRIFGSEKVFKQKFEDSLNYTELKKAISPVIYRTLRKDVSKYMHFANRECRTFDFELSEDEKVLYALVNSFLKKENLYCIPTRNRSLIILVIRKLLASSSFALIDTFEVMRDRLEKLLMGTHSANANEGFDIFWKYLDDEIDEDDFEADDEDLIFQHKQIENEIEQIDQIIDQAKKIRVNAKIKALKKAIEVAFEMQKTKNISSKVVIFTESKRTQNYISTELIESGISPDDIVLFNGDNNDIKTKEIYKQYSIRHFNDIKYGQSVERKHAIVEYFKENAKILILTDAGSEGLNLQFCNTVINYDLPWNPMKIEQRIGRCHRYGQQNDVIAINLLNTSNAADKRVYDILSKKFELFDGVFGASNIALGILESGLNFEREILSIYQRCNTSGEFKHEFDKLDRKLDAKRNNKARQLRDILLSKTSEEKITDLDNVRINIDNYLKQYEYWNNVENDELVIDAINYWYSPKWGEKNFGSHGYLFVGFFSDNTKILSPVLLITDEKGKYVDFTEDDLLPSLVRLDDEDIKSFFPTAEEKEFMGNVYDNLVREMIEKYRKDNAPIIEYNNKKIENWKTIQMNQYNLDIQEIVNSANEYEEKAKESTEFLEKVELRKKAKEKLDKAKIMQERFHEYENKVNDEAKKEIEEFADNLLKKPLLLIKIVLKF